MKKVCVIGYPAKHSLSPVIHNYWLEKYNIEGSYEIREIEPDKFDDFFLNLHKEGYVGCNVTLPFKEKAFELSDPFSFTEKVIGAVNTIIIEDGRYVGHNTDAYGFIKNIEKSSKEFDFKKGAAVVLGAGGAARAVINSLLFKDVPEIILLNRTIEKAENIRNDLHVNIHKNQEFILERLKIIPWEERNEALAEAKLLVNTTSLGMVGQPELDINIDKLPKDALVTDIVYRPLETKLLNQARERGNPVVDGLGMLLYQAVPGFELWFKEENVEVTPELRKKVEAML